MTINIFQTVEDRLNANEIEETGPFKCTRSNAWLGDGYYFWDSYVEHAHSWGMALYSVDYVICKATCSLDDRCFDLDRADHLSSFKEVMLGLETRGKVNIRVPQVIEFMKKMPSFKFEAIRVRGNDSFQKKSKMKFSNSQAGYLDLMPQIQICLLKKTSISFSNYKIIYPQEYVEDQLF